MVQINAVLRYGHEEYPIGSGEGIRPYYSVYTDIWLIVAAINCSNNLALHRSAVIAPAEQNCRPVCIMQLYACMQVFSNVVCSSAAMNNCPILVLLYFN